MVHDAQIGGVQVVQVVRVVQVVLVINLVQVVTGQDCRGGQSGPGDQVCQCIWFTWSK